MLLFLNLILSIWYSQSLEPWLVSEVRISGDIKLISVVASGLPTSEDLEHIVDLETLRSVPLPPRQPVDFLIGVFSTANNFKRRMAVRRTWMQYSAVRSGAVAVRFFVGLVGSICTFLISPIFFSSFIISVSRLEECSFRPLYNAYYCRAYRSFCYLLL